MPKKKRPKSKVPSPIPVYKYAYELKNRDDRIEFYLAVIASLCEQIFQQLSHSKSQNPVAKTPK